MYLFIIKWNNASFAIIYVVRDLMEIIILGLRTRDTRVFSFFLASPWHETILIATFVIEDLGVKIGQVQIFNVVRNLNETELSTTYWSYYTNAENFKWNILFWIDEDFLNRREERHAINRICLLNVWNTLADRLTLH